MAKILFEFTQDLPLTWGVLALHLGSRQNVFHLREPTEKKFQKIKHQGLKKNKILAKAKEVFKWKVFFLKKKNFK